MGKTMTDDGYEIVRTFGAPRDLVFSMFTTPEHFAVWWGGSTVAVPLDSITLDAREGGDWKATMVGEDSSWSINWIGEFLEVVPYERLRIAFSDRPGPERDIFTIVLTEVDEATRLEFSQSGGHLSAEQYEQARAGTDSFLDVMEGHLATLQD